MARPIYKLGSNQWRKQQKATRRNLKAKTWATIAIILLMLAIAEVGFVVNAYQDKMERKAQAITVNLQVVNVQPGAEAPMFEEPRAEKIYQYLKAKNSPLAVHAGLMVEVADANAIDWTLIPAIAGKESSFGRAIQEGSHNAWGVMTWDQAGNRSIRNFKSWEEGIRFEGALLGKHYREDMYGAVQARYCPSFECSDTWVENVKSFSEGIQTQ